MTKIEVYYCEKKTHCNWKCFALDAYGLGFGIIPSGHDAWRIWHDKECGGKLIQAEIVTPDSTPPSDKREPIPESLELTDEEIQEIKDSDYPTYKGWSPANSLYVAIAKAQLQKVQPQIEKSRVLQELARQDGFRHGKGEAEAEIVRLKQENEGLRKGKGEIYEL